MKISKTMGQYQARTKSIDEEQAPGTTERGPTDGAPLPVFGSPIDSEFKRSLIQLFFDILWWSFVLRMCR